MESYFGCVCFRKSLHYHARGSDEILHNKERVQGLRERNNVQVMQNRVLSKEHLQELLERNNVLV